MRLLFTGASSCEEATLKRLLLIADAVVFHDRPSATFGRGEGSWGLVGSPSPVRDIIPAFLHEESPVELVAADAPTQGPPSPLVLQLLEQDLQNPDFRRILLEGLESNDLFASKFISPKAKYQEGLTGEAVRAALVADKELLTVSLEGPRKAGPGLFDVEDARGRVDTLRTLIVEASVRLTCSMLIATDGISLPVTDDPFLA